MGAGANSSIGDGALREHQPCASLQAVQMTQARHDEQIQHLIAWQQSQNHNLQRLADRIEALDLRVDAALQRLNERVDQRLQALNVWLVGLLGSTVLALALLAANLVAQLAAKR